MKKFRFIISAVAMIALVTLACQVTTSDFTIGSKSVRGDGNVVEEERIVSGIRRVRIANQGDLSIELGEEESLTIEAEDNLLEYIDSDVQGGELVLETRRGYNLRNTEPIRYTLTVLTLEEITVSSSGDVSAPQFETEDFRINVSSSGDVRVDQLEVGELRVNISSSGDITIGTLYAERIDVGISSSGSLNIQDGEVDEQDISISSSGSYDARDVPSRTANVRISSSGTATVRVSDKLDANLSSSGDLYYIGEPSLNARESSSGDVIQIGGD